MRYAVLLAALGLAACATQPAAPAPSPTDAQIANRTVTALPGWGLERQTDGAAVLVDKRGRAELFISLEAEDGGAGFPLVLPVGERISLPRKGAEDIAYVFESRLQEDGALDLQVALSQPLPGQVLDSFAGMSISHTLKPGQHGVADLPNGSRMRLGGARLQRVDIAFVGLHASGGHTP